MSIVETPMAARRVTTAAAAAKHIGISVDFQNLDGKAFDPEWRTRPSVAPEPSEGILSQYAVLDPAQPDPLGNIRVLFVGEGPDNALLYMDWKPYMRWLLKKGRFIELSSALRSRLSARPWAEIISSLSAAFRSTEAFPATEDRPAWLRHNVVDGRGIAGAHIKKLHVVGRDRRARRGPIARGGPVCICSGWTPEHPGPNAPWRRNSIP